MGLASSDRRRGSSVLAAAAIAIVALLMLAARPAEATVFSNPTPIAIPTSGNSNAYPGTIQVSGLTGQVTDVNVTLNGFGHELPRDAAVMLVPPAGSAIPLMYEAGGSSPVTGLTLVFDDSAAGPMAMGPPVSSGFYKPTANVIGFEFPAPGPGFNYCNPGPGGSAPFCTLASATNGINPNGTWGLFVRDFFGPSKSGAITGGWSLDISVPPPAQPPAPPADTLAPTVTLTKKPPKSGMAHKVKFAFSASEAGSSFQCKLDKAAFKACSSPFKKTVGLGSHNFEVKATDAAGNTGKAVKYGFKVVKKTPR